MVKEKTGFSPTFLLTASLTTVNNVAVTFVASSEIVYALSEGITYDKVKP